MDAPPLTYGLENLDGKDDCIGYGDKSKVRPSPPMSPFCIKNSHAGRTKWKQPETKASGCLIYLV